MPRNKSAGVALAKLIDNGPDPIYVLDDRWTIVYCNAALAAWAGLEEDEIVGRRLGYHPPHTSESESTHAAGILAGLAPPPMALAGNAADGHVSAMTEAGRLSYRRAAFLPIGESSPGQDRAGRCVGTIALVGPEDLSSAQLAEVTSPTRQSTSELSDALHLAVRQFRSQQTQLYDLDRFIGKSPAMLRAREQIVVAASTEASVLIQGLAGSGRSHAARAIYYRALERLQGDLLPLGCDLLSEEQLRSAIEMANSRVTVDEVGALLLLEVDQLTESAQSRLAEMFASSSFRWRILSTAVRDVVELAEQGAFRADLACQLSTIHIRLPALVDRKEDLPYLAQLFVEEANREASRQIGGLSNDALDLLRLYDWPGQVDELAATIREAHHVCSGDTIAVSDLPAKIRHATDSLAFPPIDEERIVLDQFLAKIERELVVRALDQAGGNKASAARLLGMTRPRLYRRLTQLDLIEKPSDEEVAQVKSREPVKSSEVEDTLDLDTPDSETPDSETPDSETPDFEVIEESDEFDTDEFDTDEFDTDDRDD